MNDGVMLNVAFILAAFAAMIGALALTVSVTNLNTDTVTVASRVWVEQSKLPALQEEYEGLVPVCTDLPVVEDIHAPIVPITCWLKVVK